VFHLAAHGSYPSQTDRRAMLETNITGLVNVVEAAEAAGFDGFVNAGSSSEYGYVNHPASESERLEPNSDYAVTKAFGTQFCRFVAISRDLPIVTLRLYSAFGPWEAPTRFVPTLAMRGLTGELPPLVDPRTARDFVYVEDVCDAFIDAARAARRRRGAIYNVGSGAQTTIREAVDVARRVLAIPDEARWGAFPARSWDTFSWVADVRTIREELGWRAVHSFEEGFVETVRWLRRPRGSTDAPPESYFS
jgi:dolichol-phosphate mannosyltransferase